LDEGIAVRAVAWDQPSKSGQVRGYAVQAKVPRNSPLHWALTLSTDSSGSTGTMPSRIGSKDRLELARTLGSKTKTPRPGRLTVKVSGYRLVERTVDFGLIDLKEGTMNVHPKPGTRIVRDLVDGYQLEISSLESSASYGDQSRRRFLTVAAKLLVPPGRAGEDDFARTVPVGRPGDEHPTFTFYPRGQNETMAIQPGTQRTRIRLRVTLHRLVTRGTFALVPPLVRLRETSAWGDSDVSHPIPKALIPHFPVWPDARP
jgi:hypothetical protein